MSNVRVGLQIALEGDKQAQQGLQRVKDGLGGLDAGLVSVDASAGKTAASMGRMNTSVGDIAKGVIGAQLLASGLQAVASAATALPRSAFDYTKELEASSVGMAGILGSMAAMNGKQLEYHQGLAISQDMIRKLGDDALRTAASSQELTSTFQALLAPGLAAKMTLDEIRQLTVTGVNAVKSIGLSGAQVVQELRDLVAGGITASGSQLATALGLKDADIAKAKASSEGLFAFLMERLKGFEDSSSRFGDTLQGRMDALKEGSTRVAAEGMKPLTDEISKTIGELGKLFVTFEKTGEAKLNPEIIASLRGVSEGLVSIMDAGKSTAAVLYENREAVGGLVAAYAAFKVGSIAAEMVQAVQAKTALAQASRLAAVQSAVESAANESAVLTSRQKTAAILAELQANVQRTAAQVAATAGTVAATQAERAHALAVTQLTAAQNAASVSGRAMGAVMGALGGPVGIAVTAFASLVGYMMSANAEAEKLAKVGQSKDRVDAASAAGQKPEDRDISRLQAQLAQLKETRDELLLDQKDGGIMRFIFGKDYDVGLDGKLRQNQAAIDGLEKSLAAAKTVTESTTASTGTLTLTLSGAEQAWRKSIDGVKTASSIQADYQDKLAGSQRAYATYIEQLKTSGASEAALQKAKVEQGQAEASLLKQRDEALKGLTKTQGASTTALDNERVSLLAKLKAEQAYAAALATRGLQADKMTEAEKSAERYALQAAKAKDARTAATYKGLEAVAREIAGQEQANAVTSEALKAHQALFDAMVNDTKAITDRASAVEAENAVFGKSRAAIEAARLAAEEQRRNDIAFAADPTYLQAMDDRIAAMRRYVQALQEADYKQVNARTDEILRAAGEQAKLYGNEVRLASLTGLERAKIVAQRQVEIKYAKELSAIDASNLSDTEKETQRLKLLEAQQIESSAAVAKVVQEDWAKTSDQINQSLTDALMRGFESGKGFLRNLGDTAVNLFKTMVLRPTITAAFTPVAAGINSAFGINGGTPGGSAMGTIQTASNINTLWGTASQALYGGSAGASLASLGYANAAGMVGGDALGALIAANGSWAGVTTGSAAAAEAAIAANLAMEAGAAVALEAGTMAAAAGTQAATAAKAAASTTGSLMSTVATAMPYLAAIAAAAMIISSFDDSGTPHSGGVAKYSAGNGLKTGLDARGEFGTTMGGVDFSQAGMQLATNTAIGLTGLLDDMAKTFGKKAGYEVITAFADDSSGDGAWGALRINNPDGTTALNWDDTRTSRWAPKEFGDGQEGMDQYLKAIAADVKTYLISQTPEWAKTVFEGLGDAPTLDQLGKAAQSVGTLHKVLGAMGENVLPSLGNATDATISSMVKAAGGADALTASLANYYDATATDLDRQQFAFTSLSKALEPLGATLPAASTGLRDWYDGLVQTASAQDLTVQANADQLASLLALNPAITAMSGVWDSTRESLFGADALGAMANAALRGDAVATSIVNAAGGLEQYGQKVSSYQQTFTTATEKTAAATAQVTAELAKVGLSMPKTRSEFKSMMDAALAMGDAGKGTVSVLLDVGEAIAGLVPESKDFLKEFLDEVPNTLSGVLTGLVTGREGAQEEGARLAKSVSDGIYEAIAQGQTAQIAQQFMANIVNPIVANVAASRSMLDGVDLAGGVATAKAQIQALRDTLADPQIAGAIREITGAVNGLIGSAGGVASAYTPGPFAIGGSAVSATYQPQALSALSDTAGLQQEILEANKSVAKLLEEYLKKDDPTATRYEKLAQQLAAKSTDLKVPQYQQEISVLKSTIADFTGVLDKANPLISAVMNGAQNSGQALTTLAEMIVQREGKGLDDGNLGGYTIPGFASDPMASRVTQLLESLFDGLTETGNSHLFINYVQSLLGITADPATLQNDLNTRIKQLASLEKDLRDWYIAQARVIAIEDATSLAKETADAKARTAELQRTGGLQDPITKLKEQFRDKMQEIDDGIGAALQAEIKVLQGQKADTSALDRSLAAQKQYLGQVFDAVGNPLQSFMDAIQLQIDRQQNYIDTVDPAETTAAIMAGVWNGLDADKKLLASIKDGSYYKPLTTGIADTEQAITDAIVAATNPAKQAELRAEIEKYKGGVREWLKAQQELLATEMLVDINAQIKDLQTQDQGPLTVIKTAIDKYVSDLKALDQYTAAAQASVDQLAGLQLTKARDELYAQLVPQEEQNAKALAGLKADFAALGQVMPETAAALRVMIDAASGDTKDKLLELVPAFVALQPAAEGAAASAETVAQAYARLRTVTRTAEQVAQERIDLEERLFQATASQAEIANLARLRIDEYNRSLYDQVIAAEAAKQAVADTRTATDQALSEVKRLIGEEITRLQDSFKATDTAYSAVERAVAAQKSTLTEQLAAAKQAESAINGIFGALRDNLRDMRGEVESTARMQAAEGQQVIRAALATGVLPEQERLQQAIQAARAGLDGTQFASATERDRAYIALQNELEALQGIAQPQLSAAEQSVALAEEQIDKLDLQLKSAKALVDQVRGVDTRVLGVQDAIGALESAVATEAAARDQIAVLNGQLEVAQGQYEALRGIKTGVDAIAPALQALADAIAGEQSAAAKAAALAAAAAAQRQAITAAAGGQYGASLEYVRDFGAGSAMADTSYANQREADIASLYQNVLGRTPDSGGLAYYAGTAMSIAEIAASLEASREDDIRDAYGGAAQQAFNDQTNSLLGLTSDIRIPGFAVGATEIPQDMLAVVHKGEQIIPAAWNPATSGWADSVRGSDPRVADLIARLIDRVERLERELARRLDEGNSNTDGIHTRLRRVSRDSDKLYTTAA